MKINKPEDNVNILRVFWIQAPFICGQVNLRFYSTMCYDVDMGNVQEDLVKIEGAPSPTDIKRLMKAAEVMELHIVQNITITDACKQVGISRATYSRWVKDGVFAPLVQAYVGPIELQIQSQALQGIAEFVDWLVKTATGKTQNATNFDRMNAGKMLWTEFASKILATSAPVVEPKPDEERDEGAEYLETEPKWKLGPGEKVIETTTVERSPAPIDVTPPEDEVVI